MKRHWIEFHPQWKHSPMTYWVYRCEDELRWHEAKVFRPPAPPPVAGKGFAMFHVELDGVPFQFASLRELRVCIEVLSRKVLPTAAQLIREGGLKGFSSHVWLARLPAGTHGLRYREKAVPYLKKAFAAFEREAPSQSDPGGRSPHSSTK